MPISLLLPKLVCHPLQIVNHFGCSWTVNTQIIYPTDACVPEHTQTTHRSYADLTLMLQHTAMISQSQSTSINHLTSKPPPKWRPPNNWGTRGFRKRPWAWSLCWARMRQSQSQWFWRPPDLAFMANGQMMETTQRQKVANGWGFGFCPVEDFQAWANRLKPTVGNFQWV